MDEYLEFLGRRSFRLPHGVEVTISYLGFSFFKNEKLPPENVPNYHLHENPAPTFLDVGYFYCPYVPVTNEH